MQIDESRLLKNFIELAEISSPSFQEDAIFDRLQTIFSELGMQVKFQTYEDSKKGATVKGKNLIATLELTDDSFPTILLSCHADTVGPCQQIEPYVENGIVKSKGKYILGADDKAGISEIIEALRTIIDKKLPHGKIEIAITSAEEVGLYGAKNLPYKELTAKHGIVIDASGDVGSVIVAAPKHNIFHLIIKGKEAHAGIEPEKGISAIKAAGEIITRFKNGKLDKFSTANIGKISGGRADNIIPGKVILTGEIRSHSLKKLKKHIQALEKTVTLIAKKTGAKISLKIEKEYDLYRAKENNPLLALLTESYKKNEMELKKVWAEGGSDANIINQNGIDCLNLTCGMQSVHSSEEFIKVSNLEKIASILVDFLTNDLKGIN